MANGFKPVHNADILTAIRNSASGDYYNRIPAATQADISDAVNALANNPPQRNEFLNALINRIGLVLIRDQNWNNPLAKFKRGMLEWGDTIEEIQTGLTQAYVYNHDREYLERDIFGTYRPEAQSSFHKINRENYYPITVNEMALRRAFVNPNGLSQLVGNVIASASTSDQWDEFLLMARMFAEYEKNDGFFKVNVPNIQAQGSTQADTNFALRRMREFAGNLQFLSRNYNAAGMPVAANIDDLELFITPEANAAIDVESLAGAFNVNRSDIPMRTTIIPREHFGIPGAQAVLTTRDFFVVADTFFETRQAENPVAIQTNYFLHHHQVVSTSRFVPAVLFTTEPGDSITIVDYDVTGVDDLVVQDRNEATVTGVTRGEYYQITGEAVTDPEGGPNSAVRYDIVGDGAELSPRTYVTQAGALYVAHDEQSDAITVTATSVDDPDFTATVELPVSGDKFIYWPPSDGSATEVTPDAPTASGNDVTIPTVEGVQYQIGGQVATGTVTITEDTTVVAVPLPGYEFPDGAVSQWEFTFTE